MHVVLETLIAALAEPGALIGHFTYFLLVLSMMMRRMVWLRSIAIIAGLTKIAYRSLVVVDPVIVFWETIFVLVNVAQLLISWYYNKRHRFGSDEQALIDIMPADVERRALRRLLRLARRRQLAAGEALTEEGRPVADLMYITEGIVQIERGGGIVAVCGAGDFIGEVSFVTGRPAGATAVAVKPVRVLSFDQARLRAAIAADAGMRRALEAGLNTNLAGKLGRAAPLAAGAG